MQRVRCWLSSLHQTAKIRTRWVRILYFQPYQIDTLPVIGLANRVFVPVLMEKNKKTGCCLRDTLSGSLFFCAAAHQKFVRKNRKKSALRNPAERPKKLAYSFFASSFLTASVSSGRILCTSPTTPKSATSKIGAPGSLLIAMMISESSIPARCWIAPEMPHAIYRFGRTVLPVWPT